MSVNEFPDGEGTDLDNRDARALTECMTALEDTPPVRDARGLYEVVSQSGRSYTVDVYEKSCTCPDARHNDHTCKHIRRVLFAAGMRPIPGWVAPDAVDERLGEQVAGVPRVVVSDGGRLTDENSDVDENHRPDDCECWNADGDLACWTCYRDGFDTPNPAEPASDE